MYLREAVVCLSCDWVYRQVLDHCPKCLDKHSFEIRQVLPAVETTSIKELIHEKSRVLVDDSVRSLNIPNDRVCTVLRKVLTSTKRAELCGDSLY